MCFYQRAVRAYQRGVATRTVVGMRLPTRGARLPTSGARLPTRGSNEDGRRYAPTNEGCASTTDLLRCEVSSDHSDQPAAQNRRVQPPSLTTGALGVPPGDSSAIYRGHPTSPRKSRDQYPYHINGKKREKVNRQFWSRHELARVADRLTERRCKTGCRTSGIIARPSQRPENLRKSRGSSGHLDTYHFR